jgi:hypothetical protein
MIIDENANIDKVKDMRTERKTAKIVGALFILATVTAVISIAFLGDTLSSPEYLTEIATNENGVVVSVIFWLLLAISVLGIGIYMYPVLKEHDEVSGIWYFSLRLLETVFIIVAGVSLLVLLTLSGEFTTAGTTAGANYEVSGSLLLALFDWSFIIGTMIFLGLGGIVLNYMLYKTQLVPRWLSAWGLVGAIAVLLYGVISLWGQDPAILAAPIAVQEMVFAVYIIAKGFKGSKDSKDFTGSPSPA